MRRILSLAMVVALSPPALGAAKPPEQLQLQGPPLGEVAIRWGTSPWGVRTVEIRSFEDRVWVTQWKANGPLQVTVNGHTSIWPSRVVAQFRAGNFEMAGGLVKRCVNEIRRRPPSSTA
jgi:hypothetical protein